MVMKEPVLVDDEEADSLMLRYTPEKCNNGQY